MGKGLTMVLKALGISITPEQAAMIEAIIPQIPERIGQATTMLNAAVKQYDETLLRIEAAQLEQRDYSRSELTYLTETIKVMRLDLMVISERLKVIEEKTSDQKESHGRTNGSNGNRSPVKRTTAGKHWRDSVGTNRSWQNPGGNSFMQPTNGNVIVGFDEPYHGDAKSPSGSEDANGAIQTPERKIEHIAGIPSIDPFDIPEVITGTDSFDRPGTRDYRPTDSGQPKRRGRPVGSKNRNQGTSEPRRLQDSLADLEALLLSLHFMGAKILEAPEWELDEAEAKKLADGIKEVAKHYSVSIDPKKMVLGQLAFAMAGIYGPRLVVTFRKQKTDKPKATVLPFPQPQAAPSQAQTSQPQSAAPQQPRQNGPVQKPLSQMTPSELVPDFPIGDIVWAVVNFPTDTQRLVIVGATGSGKTQAALWHLSRANFDTKPWIIYDFKHDELIGQIEGVQTLTLDAEIPEQPGLYVVHPRPDQTMEVEAQMWKIWTHENVGVYVDEGSLLGKANPAFRSILTQGRSKHIPVIVLVQRPVFVDQFIFSEASFFQIFRLNRDKDLETVNGFIPFKLKERLPDYHSYYYDVGANKIVVMKAVPDREALLNAFYWKLESLKRAV
jgi:hypothetical protein